MMENCKSCGRKRELILCNDCFINLLMKEARYALGVSDGLNVYELNIKFDELMEEVKKIKEALIEFKIRGFKLKKTKK